MKCFTFTNWQTEEVFKQLMSSHDLCKRLLDQAQTEAADSHLPDSPHADSDDMLRDDDERVFDRLARKLEAAVDDLAEQHLGAGLRPSDMCEDADPFTAIVVDAFRMIDYRRIAQAIYYGVEPVEPWTPEIPEIR